MALAGTGRPPVGWAPNAGRARAIQPSPGSGRVARAFKPLEAASASYPPFSKNPQSARVP
jgi:hypothetical protein